MARVTLDMKSTSCPFLIFSPSVNDRLKIMCKGVNNSVWHWKLIKIPPIAFSGQRVSDAAFRCRCFVQAWPSWNCYEVLLLSCIPLHGLPIPGREWPPSCLERGKRAVVCLTQQVLHITSPVGCGQEQMINTSRLPGMFRKSGWQRGQDVNSTGSGLKASRHVYQAIPKRAPSCF